jgi:hypothetical protein
MKTKGRWSCERCSHDYDEHGRNGAACQHVHFSESRIVHGNPDDGVTVNRDWTACECLYFVGAVVPGSVREMEQR